MTWAFYHVAWRTMCTLSYYSYIKMMEKFSLLPGLMFNDFEVLKANMIEKNEKKKKTLYFVLFSVFP